MRSLKLKAVLISCILVGVMCHGGQAQEYTPGPVTVLHTWLGDQCSFVPDLDVGECCYDHDIAYGIGGNERKRREVDIEFRDCIRQKNRPIVASIYYAGVRLFGWLFFNYN